MHAPTVSMQRVLERQSQTKALAKKVLTSAGLLKAASAVKVHLSWAALQFRRGFGEHGERLAKSYLTKTNVPKLHIGCGSNILPNWLNADYFPNRKDVLYLDATKPFRLPNNSFDFVFSEHMIEHISYIDATFMLRECHRVLRPGGRIRISTPDLAFLVGLYASDKSELQENYIEWSASTFVPDAPRASDTFVINDFVRDWGHQFIYDEKTLCAALHGAGFNNLVKCDIRESASEAFCNLENERRMPEGFLKLETLTIEGAKP
jgi:predicted SAM-dependent methyltransferase